MLILFPEHLRGFFDSEYDSSNLDYQFVAKKDFPIRGIENDTLYENETEIFLNTLPEEQRSLLQAAIQTGELDENTLISTIGFVLYSFTFARELKFLN